MTSERDERAADKFADDLQPGIPAEGRWTAAKLGFLAGCAHKEAELAALREALKTISKNSCCDQCQEAKRWADKALLFPEEKK